MALREISPVKTGQFNIHNDKEIGKDSAGMSCASETK